MEKKLIVMTPEWVLENLSDTMIVEEKMFITAVTEMEAELIRLALNTLKIDFEELEGDSTDYYNYGFEFLLKDIIADCPSLFKRNKYGYY